MPPSRSRVMTSFESSFHNEHDIPSRVIVRANSLVDPAPDNDIDSIDIELENNDAIRSLSVTGKEAEEIAVAILNTLHRHSCIDQKNAARIRDLMLDVPSTPGS